MFIDASYRPRTIVEEVAGLKNDLRPAFAREVTLEPKQILEIEIPVSPNANFGITFMADVKVSATLIDGKGAIRGTNPADAPEAKGFFRTIFVEKGVTGGTWKLKLENTGTFKAAAVIAAWNNAVTRKP
jgi:hypothetical protein